MKMAFCICALWFFSAAIGQGSDSTLVNMGELWSYSPSPPPANASGPAWMELGFDDSKWSMARSGFDLENSRPALQSAQAAPARILLRRRFFLDDPAAIRSLRLKVEHEQGFIAYLNGKRVTQVVGAGVSLVKQDPFLPAEEDAVLSLADIDLTSSRSLLQKGENVVALEGAQTWTGLSPVTLSALLTANISRGPFVQNNTPRSVVIAWRTDLLLDSVVKYGRTMALGQSKTLPALTNDHAVTLTGLEPDTQYYYRVTGRSGSDSVASDIDFFQTFRERGPVHFAFIADTGQNTAAQFAQAQVLAQLAPELVLHGGDIIYAGFDDKTPDTRVFAQYLRQTGQMRNTPFFLSIGNHDLNCCAGDPAEWNPTNMVLNAPHFQSTFYLPTNSATGTEHFYSFDQGDVHFVALYNPWFTVYDFNANTQQYQWLTNDLAGSAKPWKVLFFHSPIAHSGEHSLADRNYNGVLDQVEMMQLIGQAARLYGVQLVLSGHDHNFERFCPTNGLHAVVAGGGGA
ncbi:MAG: metallophosphoesterase family protein [Verrucomicrobia bacterium]|nr:metallophosphoesterase family protein [Verrucomicrobiota bacterium]